MKKTYTTPELLSHGSVESITQFFGNADKNDFLFFSGSNSAVSNTNGSPITGDGSIDGIINGTIQPGTTLQGQ